MRPEPRRTLVRGTCTAVDAVVFIDEMAYVLKLSQSSMQLWAFDELLSALSFDEPPAALTSPRYGYSIELTRDWQIAPSTREWTGPGRPLVPCPMPPRTLTRLRASRSPPARSPPKRAEDRFITDAAPLPVNVRLNGPVVRCVFGDTVLERGPIPPWETEVIGGHRARVRSMCGTVDAVVFVGGRGYLFTLTSGSGTAGDLERFRRLVASVRFDDGRTTFVSDAYGYSVRIPGDWQATPASAPWAGGIRDDLALDRFTAGAGGPTPQFTVTARAVDASMTETDWIGKFAPNITQMAGTACRFGSGYVLAPDPDASWHPATIDGREALVRAACGRIDGVVFSDGIGYWMRLTTSERRTGADLAAFYLLADTIDLDAVEPTFVASGSQAGATGSQTFTSGRYDYTIRIPDDWTVEAASKRWSGAGSWTADMADQFSGPDSSARRLHRRRARRSGGRRPRMAGPLCPHACVRSGQVDVRQERLALRRPGPDGVGGDDDRRSSGPDTRRMWRRPGRPGGGRDRVRVRPDHADPRGWRGRLPPDRRHVPHRALTVRFASSAPRSPSWPGSRSVRWASEGRVDWLPGEVPWTEPRGCASSA